MDDLFWNALSSYRESERKRQDKTRFERGDMLRSLRTVGVTEITGTYDAYGDSGNVEDIAIVPAEISVSDDMDSRLLDLIWDTAYGLHPGFENNDGGFGELTWDVVADTIDLEHGDRFTDVNYTNHEGI